MIELEDIFFNKLNKRCDKWHPYLNAYQKHFSKFRGKECKLLEIGVQSGGSLEMWKQYFGDNCEIYGVDIDDNVLNLKYDFEVNISIGDQEDPAFWKEYTDKNGYFDIIIDDGGHTMKQQENTLVSLFNKLNYGGVFLIEDTHTSYWEEYDGGFQKKDSIIEISKNLIDLLNVRHIRENSVSHKTINNFCGLESVTYYDSMIFLEKEIPKDFKRILNM